MGIYIEGIKMPKNEIYLRIDEKGEVYVYGSYPTELYKAVPVPKHDRLGDLDKLENGLRHMAKYQYGERQQGILGCCETIRLAPTIIPAEEGE